MADQVTLLSLPASPFAMGVKIALAEKGVSFECFEEKFPNKSEQLLKLNPVTKQVPVLVHQGKPVCESLVILEYIEEAWKAQGTAFFPDDSLHGRAGCRFWANFCNTKFWETALLVMKRLDQEQAKAVADTLEHFSTLEREWSKLDHGKPFLYGEKLSLADIVLAPIVTWKPALEAVGNFSFPGADKCPRMATWFEAVQKHPSVQASVADSNFLVQNAFRFQDMLKSRKAQQH